MDDRNFTHLHVHSSYTLLGGIAKVEDLVSRAASEGFTHFALTDTNALYGAVAFSRACRKAGIQPIIGMVVGVAWREPEGEIAPGRLVLLATGPDGYRSLCKLTSQIQGSPDRETRMARGVMLESLAAHREGLICLSGGRSGWIERYLRAGDRKLAYRYAGRLAEIYTRNLYLSLEIHQPQDASVASETMEIGRGLGVPSVAVQPIYCLDSSAAPKLRLLAAIDRNCTLEEVPDWLLPNEGDQGIDLGWLDREEVVTRFADFPQAVEQVAEVVERCYPALPEGDPIWPILKLPRGQTPDEALADRARLGLRQKYGPEPSLEVSERLEIELESITGHGYAPLFLVVEDIVRFAHEVDLPVSTRGSVANSLVAYCMGITTVDPVEHGLLFERFLNPARRDLPDIDLDFCSRRRDEVLEYVRRTYGEEKVALVATISTMRPRSAVRETAKAFGLDEEGVNELAGWVPRWHRRGVTLEEVLEKAHSTQQREILRAAFGIVGQPHHLSLHPGGVVITPGPMTDVLPVQWSAKGFLITQYDHNDVEEIGLPKLDILGIRALTVLADASQLIRRYHDPAFRLEDIPFDDEQTADLLSRGETIGVFQCESFGAMRTLRQLQARRIRDMAIANAFFRPGPIMGGMAETFIRRFREEEAVVYLHPSLEPILGFTKGVLIFQEQVLRVAREIAGLNWQEADQLRRGISKVRSVDMTQVERRFIQGCQRPPPEGHGLSKEQAQKLWEQAYAFSGFGFNQGHATAYANVSYRSAFIKAHWPVEFLCARLADRGGYHHPAIYMAEAMRLGIPIRPPHVNYSGRRFTLSWGEDDGGARPCLWMGLDQVRDLRQDSMRRIIAEREREPFQSVSDLAARVDLQKKELMHLIQCGALDGLGENRATLLAETARFNRAGGGKQMAFSFATPQVSPETAQEAMTWEMRILGYPISVNPLALVEVVPEHVPIRGLPDHENQMISTVGMRLPGWTGGQGFFLGDGDTFIVARTEKGRIQPKVWQPQHVRGRWLGDGMGTFWFQVQEIDALAFASR
jgi:DNA polymerase-3 subunit alpha